MKRREFLKSTMASLLVPSAAFGLEQQKDDPLAGIQISPFSIFDEGIENCLDTLRDKGGINALFIYSQSYYPGYNKPPNVMATDHGIPVRDMRHRRLPCLWVRHSKEAFAGKPVQHQVVDESFEYGNRDILKEIRKPATERHMKIYARILEADTRRCKQIPGYESVLTVDHEGRPGHGPCWNHPHYREWVYTTIRELVTNYELDGLQYGAERTGALSHVLFRGRTPTCFCQYCADRNRQLGIDVNRARTGFAQLYSLIKRAETGDANPLDGLVTEIIRIFLRFPEVLSWDYQWFQADEEICSEIHRIAKSIRPNIDSGRHVDHQRSSWDIFFRAALTYEEMAKNADFIKPIMYHDAMGPRLRWWVLDTMGSRILKEFSTEQSLDLFYSLFGHDATKLPKLDELDRSGLGPEYVVRETQRCKQAVGNNAKVYAGIGIDVPWYIPDGMEPRHSDPEVLTEAVRRSLAAGADGVLASREYDEMRISSLEAFKRGLTASH